jgi:hypothetical protein
MGKCGRKTEEQATEFKGTYMHGIVFVSCTLLTMLFTDAHILRIFLQMSNLLREIRGNKKKRYFRLVQLPKFFLCVQRRRFLVQYYNIYLFIKVRNQCLIIPGREKKDFFTKHTEERKCFYKHEHQCKGQCLDLKVATPPRHSGFVG